MVAGIRETRVRSPRLASTSPRTMVPSRSGPSSGWRATRPASNRAPALIAWSSSHASSARRVTARPATPGPYTACTAAPGPVTSIPANLGARSRRSPSRPSASSHATAPGFSVSPHNLSRGKSSRSMMRTRAPARASTSAAMEPAGPAPATMASSTIGSPASAACGPTRGLDSIHDRPRTSALFFDPNPRQLHSAASTCADRAVFGTTSRSHSGSGSV